MEPKDSFDPLMHSSLKHTGNAGKGIYESSRRREDSLSIETIISIIMLCITFSGMLLFAGAETMKIVYRTKFGKKGISIGKIIFSFLCFAGLAYFFITKAHGEKNYFLLLSAGIINGVFSIYLLIKGITEWQKASQDSSNRPIYSEGESKLLSFLVENGWKDSDVQFIAEPLLTIAIGVFFLGINPIISLELVFCAISVWLSQMVDIIINRSPERQMQQKINRGGYNSGMPADYSIINPN